ncbi:hypothetical protein, partial [Acinetobacter baumannii]
RTAAVLDEHDIVSTLKLPEDAQYKLLLRATNVLAFFISSPLDLCNMGQSDFKANFSCYVQCFSKGAGVIFE